MDLSISKLILFWIYFLELFVCDVICNTPPPPHIWIFVRPLFCLFCRLDVFKFWIAFEPFCVLVSPFCLPLPTVVCTHLFWPIMFAHFGLLVLWLSSLPLFRLPPQPFGLALPMFDILALHVSSTKFPWFWNLISLGPLTFCKFWILVTPSVCFGTLPFLFAPSPF